MMICTFFSKAFLCSEFALNPQFVPPVCHKSPHFPHFAFCSQAGWADSAPPTENRKAQYFREVNLTEWLLNHQLKCYMRSKLTPLGLIMKFLLSGLTITPTCMTIIPSGPNLMIELKTFGRILVYLITQQSDQLWPTFFPKRKWFSLGTLNWCIRLQRLLLLHFVTSVTFCYIFFLFETIWNDLKPFETNWILREKFVYRFITTFIGYADFFMQSACFARSLLVQTSKSSYSVRKVEEKCRTF